MTVAQALALTQQQLQLPINRLLSSTLNDRDDEDFAGEEFDRLVASVAVRGVLQPILVRPAPTTGKGEEHFEIICGHRRTEAARKAGLESVPAAVQAMGDREAVEAMISENSERLAMHPLAEAKAFRRLVELGASTAELAEKFKKSRRDVEVILQLGKLSDKVQAAFRAGKLDKTRAVLIARIPVEKIQLEAMKQLQRDRPDDDFPCNARHALEIVRREFMLELAKAPFDTKDAGLVAAAGACTGCPFNTATQPDLFADLGKGVALCTKSSCFHEKADESWKLKIAERTAKGLKTLTPAESKKVFSEYGGLSGDSGYIRLEEQCRDDSKWRTYKQLLGKSARGAVILARDPKGQELELLPRQGMKQLLRDAGHDFWKKEKKSSSSSKSNGVSPKVKAKQEADEQLRHKTQKALVLKILAALEGALPIELWRIAAKNACHQDDVLLSQRFGDGSISHDPNLQKEAWKWIEKASVDQLRALVLAICLQGEIEGYQPKARNELLELLKIDEKAIKEEVKAELAQSAVVAHQAVPGEAAPTGKKTGKARRGKEAPAEA